MSRRCSAAPKLWALAAECFSPFITTHRLRPYIYGDIYHYFPKECKNYFENLPLSVSEVGEVSETKVGSLKSLIFFVHGPRNRHGFIGAAIAGGLVAFSTVAPDFGVTAAARR